MKSILIFFFIFNLAENIIVRANSLANSLLKILPEALVESCIWRFFMQKDDWNTSKMEFEMNFLYKILLFT
jgi:hypothetical protein